MSSASGSAACEVGTGAVIRSRDRRGEHCYDASRHRPRITFFDPRRDLGRTGTRRSRRALRDGRERLVMDQVGFACRRRDRLDSSPATEACLRPAASRGRPSSTSIALSARVAPVPIEDTVGAVADLCARARSAIGPRSSRRDLAARVRVIRSPPAIGVRVGARRRTRHPPHAPRWARVRPLQPPCRGFLTGASRARHLSASRLPPTMIPLPYRTSRRTSIVDVLKLPVGAPRYRGAVRARLLLPKAPTRPFFGRIWGDARGQCRRGRPRAHRPLISPASQAARWSHVSRVCDSTWRWSMVR